MSLVSKFINGFTKTLLKVCNSAAYVKYSESDSCSVLIVEVIGFSGKMVRGFLILPTSYHHFPVAKIQFCE